ncbi:RimL Acetyltransferases, including N-acetylases of ribosomal proteins [Rhabdaerophilaceae bacterium]
MQPAIADLPMLQSARLQLRQRDMRDLDDLMQLNADPEVMRYIHPPEDPKSLRRTALSRIEGRFAGGLGYWAVTLKDEPGRFLGYVGLIPANRIGPEIEISYRFARAFQRQGYGHEAMIALLAYGFGTLDLKQVEIHTHPENQASRRLAARLGFCEAGTVPVLGEIWLRLILKKPDHAGYQD